ncbi:hypothetical protein OUZ56_026589 [Daphnia magna]|uniref:Uncharacterized protein n=1 Tax=Daphnia magna TaxID=35525 RepID=A0ABQ9ZMB3_9CRUS|nr:hypothetical protein OUZ56_026589 [Daphnia magna]
MRKRVRRHVICGSKNSQNPRYPFLLPHDLIKQFFSYFLSPVRNGFSYMEHCFQERQSEIGIY